MQKTKPVNKNPSALSHPANINQITLIIVLNPVTFKAVTSLPNGHNTNLATLNNCKPTGIPIIVIHDTTPASSITSAQNIPPNTSQIILPNVFILSCKSSN